MLAGDALGVELHAMDREIPVVHGHDDPVLGPGGGDQHIRQRVPRDDQAMIARGVEGRGHALQDAGAVMGDRAALAVHRHRRAHHLAAERLADRLVAQTDAHQRYFPRGGGDQGEADPRLVRRAGAGREHDGLGVPGQRVLHGQLVVAHDLARSTDIADEMDEVEGEAVVIVDEQDHGRILAPPSCAGQRWGGRRHPAD